MPYTQRPIKVKHQPWLTEAMPDRGQIICGVTLHSTRGGPNSSVANDGPATENWAASPANRGKNNDGSPAWWGGYQDLVVWHDGTRVVSTDWDHEYPTYGAGYGDSSSWDLSEYHLQVELAQHVVDAPFDARTIDSAAEFVAWAAHKYNFPIVRLPFLTQREVPVPRGISAHDASMNGRKLGKSDPGPLFPWDAFLRKAMAYYNGGGNVSDTVSRAEFEELKRITTERYVDDHDWLRKLDTRVGAVEPAIGQIRQTLGEQGQRIQKLEDKGNHG